MSKKEEPHDYLKPRHFPVRPWAFKIFMMCLSLSLLGFFKHKMYNDNKLKNRPQTVIRATRPAK